MAKAKTQTQYREGTLGWWLMEAGWEPVHVTGEPYPLWRLDGFEKLLTGWEARWLELLRIGNEFKARTT
jgi:hypothetical protein